MIKGPHAEEEKTVSVCGPSGVVSGPLTIIITCQSNASSSASHVSDHSLDNSLSPEFRLLGLYIHIEQTQASTDIGVALFYCQSRVSIVTNGFFCPIAFFESFFCSASFAVMYRRSKLVLHPTSQDRRRLPSGLP